MVEIKTRQRGRPCEVCKLPLKLREVVDDMLREELDFQYISKFIKINEQALRRHKINHLGIKPVKKDEFRIEWVYVNSSDSWAGYDLKAGEELVGKSYLKERFEPVGDTILRKRKPGLSTFRII